MKRFALIIPFLFVLASLLQLYYISAIVVSPDQILRPLIALWVLLLFLLWPVYWFLRDWNLTALLLTFFVTGFCFSSSFFSTLLMFTIIVGVICLPFLYIRRIKVDVVHFAYLLSGVSVFFIGYSIFVISDMLSKVPWTDYRQAVYEAKTYSFNTFSTPSVKHDIYYIILDGYARSDILQEMFGYDNSEFVAYLEGQDFIVPVSSVSNYPTTHLSVASMLNMDYIQKLSPGLEESYNRWLMGPLIDYSRTRALLESQGYKTVSVSTNWSITDNATTNTYFHPYPVMLNDFESFVLDSTPLKLFEPLLGEFASVPSFETQRKIVLYNFETLVDLPKFPGPKFVFVHIISPHPPFVFDRNGNPVNSSYSFSFKDATEYPGSREEYRKRYLDQLQFINDNLRKTIGVILAESKNPPIIILQGDHGSGMLADFTSSKNTCIKERFSPFAAYYLPGFDSRSIPADIATVNILRIIFNEYFDANMPILESRHYFYEKPVSFYDFEDVTARINDRCGYP